MGCMRAIHRRTMKCVSLRTMLLRRESPKINNMKYSIILSSFLLISTFADAQSIHEYLEFGKSARDKKEYDKAISAFTTVIAKDPEHSFAYYLRSTCYAEQRKYEEACANIDTAISIDPWYELFYTVRGEYLFHMRKYDEALSTLNKSIELDSTQEYAYCYRAQIYRKTGELRLALKNIIQASKLDPGRSDFYFIRGGIYQDLNQRDSAILFYTKAYETTENYVPVLILAATMRDLGEAETALIWINWSVDKFGRYAGNIGTRGEIYLKLGRYAESLRDFDEVIQILESKNDYRLANAYHSRGLCHDSMGNRALALKDFDDALRLDSTHGLSYSARGSLSMRAGNYKLALEDFAKAIQYEPTEGVTYYLRGLLHLKKKNTQAACTDFALAQKYRYKGAEDVLRRHCGR